MEYIQIFIYVALNLFIVFIVVPYILTYMLYMATCGMSGQSILMSIKKGLKVPFKKEELLSLFIFIDICFVVVFVIGIFKVLYS